MRKALFIAVFGLAAWTTVRADEAAVRETIAGYVEAFNQQDLDAVVGFWAEQATHVDRETGERTEGRDAIREDIAEVFKKWPETRLSGSVDHVRMINDDVAKVEGVTSVGGPDDGPSASTFSAILVRHDGKWQIESIEESPLPEPATPYDALRELEWMIGRWTDDSDEARVDTTVRWSANQTYLIRSFVLQEKEGEARQGTQVIGWDPRSLQIRSWSFNSDGSFGDGTWSKNGGDWLVKSTQTLASGEAASGTYVIKQVDDDTMTVQLIGHEIEGEPVPTSDVVTVVRVAEEEPAAEAPQPKKARQPGVRRPQ